VTTSSPNHHIRAFEGIIVQASILYTTSHEDSQQREILTGTVLNARYGILSTYLQSTTLRIFQVKVLLSTQEAFKT